MTDPHGLEIAPLLQTTLEIALVAIAMIALLAPRDRRVGEAVLLIALAVLGRIAMAPLPSIQPVTVLVMITAIRLGTARGVSLGILTAYLSNLYLGGGPWTIIQALSWGSIGLLTGILADRMVDRDNELRIGSLSGYSILMAFVFGFMVTLPLTLQEGVSIWWSGIPFDVLHAVGNLTIITWAMTPVDRTLQWVRPDLNRGLTAPSRQV